MGVVVVSVVRVVVPSIKTPHTTGTIQRTAKNATVTLSDIANIPKRIATLMIFSLSNCTGTRPDGIRVEPPSMQRRQIGIRLVCRAIPLIVISPNSMTGDMRKTP
jgi:hypothetical protein